MRNEKLEMIKGMRSVFLTSSHSFFLWDSLLRPQCPNSWALRFLLFRDIIKMDKLSLITRSCRKGTEL